MPFRLEAKKTLELLKEKKDLVSTPRNRLDH